MARVRILLCTTTMLAGLSLSGLEPAGAQKSPTMPNISVPNISSTRLDFSIRGSNALRNVDTGNWRGVIAPPESNDDAKKKKKTESNKGSKKKKNVAKKATGAVKGASVSSPSTAPISGVNLGSPAGQKIEALQDKLGIESLDAVQDAAALSGALGTPGAGGWQPPISPSDPGSAGPAQTLQDPMGGKAEGGSSTFTHWRTDFPPGARQYVDSHGGYRGEGGYSVTERGDGAVSWSWGSKTPNLQGGYDSYRVEALYAGGHQGELMGWSEVQETDLGNGARTRITTYRYGRDGSVLSRSIETSSDGGRTWHGRTTQYGNAVGGATDSSGNTISGGTASGQTTPAQQRAATGVSSGNTISGGTKPDSSSTGDKPDKPASADRPDKPASADNTNKPDKKSQPVEGGPDYRNYWGEMGVTHPGGRPKQQARGSDDRNIPDPRFGHRDVSYDTLTPEERKTMTGNWCDGVECAAPGGGSSPGRHASDFAQPPAGSGAGQISPANPIVPGVVLPGGAGNAPSIIPDRGPTEQK